MIGVNVKEIKSLERSLKIFREKIKNTKVVIHYHENMYFEKPSVKKRKAKYKSIYKQKLKTELENND